MAMGYRYAEGLGGLRAQCRAAFLYLEPAAYLATQHVARTRGLELLELKKLKLDPYVLDTGLQIDAQLTLQVADGDSLADLEDRLEFEDQSHEADPRLVLVKGLYILSREKTDSAYKRAYGLFEKAQELDSESEDAPYYLGLMNLLGLGRDQDIEAALGYFKNPYLTNNEKALNAKGYIHFHAPGPFEKDPTKLALFGGVRKDLKSAYRCFKKAADLGYPNAQFNLGALYLSGQTIPLPISEADDKLEFSFSKAYKLFAKAAERGHTLSAYNLAVMHHVGLGTY